MRPFLHYSVFVALMSTVGFLHAQEHDLDYVAEHLIEMNMDGRYLAFPELPLDPAKAESRVQLGYAAYRAGLLSSRAEMLGIHGYFASDYLTDAGWIVGAFIDPIQFHGRKATTPFNPLFADAFPFERPTTVQVNNVDGHALHAGLSLAFTQQYASRWGWQLGLAVEYYRVSKFDIRFVTLDQRENFAATVDYRARYDSVTPYASLTWIWADASTWRFTTRLINAYPTPHRGFYGRVRSDEFDIAGDTERAGHGKHIPDFYLGWGFTVENRDWHWRVDIGASAFLALAEPQMHKGGEVALYAVFSLPLF